MKYILFLEALTGVGLLHILFILLGTLAYVLDKFLEQYNKGLTEGKKLSFKEFLMEPPTWVGAVLTIILSFISSVVFIVEIGTERPLLTAVLSGATAFGGYAFIRQRIKSYGYKQQFKSQNSTGLEDGPNDEQQS